ncbi:MAG: bifunctional diaminohydroxyphosphoribosylaminopyrimidine deaminase/5-amino-6-(5-phosphoribosylamino)uracil reductase RibD [Idiomarina sp.]
MTSSFTAVDYEFMQQALDLAEQGRFSAAPNPCVGCVIVADGQIIGEGFHQRAGTPHAEINAISAIGRENSSQLKGATAYVTLEPCSHFGRTPPCADALIAAKVGRVVVAMQDPNPQVAGQGIERLRNAGIQVDVGLMEQLAERVNLGFCMRMRNGRPWVRLKLASSLDGATALQNGESQWITGPEARSDVHRWRALSQAVVSSATSVIRDNARLTARHNSVQQQPLRVILDKHNELDSSHVFFQQQAAVLLVRGQVDTTQSWPSNCEVITAALTVDGSFDLVALMTELGKREINSVWLECGKSLGGSFWQANLVDELILYLAPKLMGSAAQGLLSLPVFESMHQVPSLNLIDVRCVGDDIRIIATKKGEN